MLLTKDRVKAASRINRFNGWTWRPYSILEHSIIGAKVLADLRYPVMTQRAFLLHDMEETEFGDIITPVKHEHMAPGYFEAVKAWNVELSVETGVPVHEIDSAAVHMMDEVLLACETRTVTTKKWKPEMPRFVDTELVFRYIDKARYEGDRGVEEFWDMWGAL